MLDNEIVTICQEQFPQADLIILTGSQVNNKEIDTNSDLDILIVDAMFSIVSSKVYKFQEFKYDFTITPLHDLDNVVYNEKFDSSGILFTMIQTGRILLQKNNLGNLLKEKIEQIAVQGTSISSSRFNNIIGDLIKMKKNFGGNLNKREAFVATNIFVNLITDAEIARLSSWNFPNKHKIKFLEKNSAIFIEEIMEIATNISNQPGDKDLRYLPDFIEYYNNRSKINRDSYDISNHFNRYLIDIGLPSLSLKSFIDFYQTVIDDVDLQKCFLYFFPSPTKYHRLFKNRFSLIFTLETGVDSKKIYFKLLIIINKHFTQQPPISLEANHIFSQTSVKSKLLVDFENVAIELNKLLTNEINNRGTFDPERLIYISIIIFGFIAKELNLSIDHILKLNKYMQARWIFNNDEQYSKNLKDLQLLSFQKSQIYSDYFKKKQLSIIAALKKGLNFDFNSDINKPYYQSLKEIRKFIVNQETNSDKGVKDNFFTNLILKDKYKIVNTDIAILYIQLIDQIVCFLDLNNVQSGLAIYLVSESIKVMKIEKHQNP